VHASKSSFLDHVKWLRRAVLAARAELLIAGDTLRALVRQGERHWILRPRFLTTLDGVTRYTSQLHETSEVFAGWLPHADRRWPIIPDAQAFDQLARSAGLPIPEGERGESFIHRPRLRIWFWNGRPVCAEREAVPHVPDGDIQVLDLMSHPNAEWMPLLRTAGQQFLTALPEDLRSSTSFTLDAIVDEQHRLSFVEMNRNVMIHPLLYPAIIESLVSARAHAPPAPLQRPVVAAT
jgi:hypothetical protein